MLLYALFCLCLALVGVAGLQLMYLFYLERIDMERKKRMHELELECRKLRLDMVKAENEIALQRKLLAEAISPAEDLDEAWADVIED
jgi:hypothetical protein